MTMKKVRVLVLICSTRPGAIGPAIAQWFIDTVSPLGATLGVELVPVPLRDLDLPFLDEEEHPASGVYQHQHTRDWSAMVEAADGFIMITPEYNYGMPAALKNALDYLSREWAWKPVGFVSYGNTSAGTRSVQHAKQVVTTLRLVPLGATVAIRIADTMENGSVRASKRLDASASSVMSELARLAHTLRPLREAAQSTATPGPLPGSYARRLTVDDAAEVAVLQRCCWVDEAIACQTLMIPALHETLDDVRAGLQDWSATGLWRDGRLLGMVRARREDDAWNIGRLAVVPDLRGAGVGRWLLRHAEAAADPDCETAALSTGARSERNIRLYRSEGFEQTSGSHGDDIIHFTKHRAIDGLTLSTL